MLVRSIAAGALASLALQACAPTPTPTPPGPSASVAQAPSTAPTVAALPSAEVAAVSASAEPARPPAPSAPAALDLIDDVLPPSLAESAGLLRKKEWKKANAALLAALKQIERSGTASEAVLARALLGRSYVELRSLDAAKSAFKLVRAGYQAALDADAPVAAGDATIRARLLINAASEATFFFAEQEGRAAGALKRPRYAGKGDKDDVLKYVSVQLKKWLAEHRAACEKVEKAYLEVLSIQPMSSPRWVVLSAQRVGSLWASHVSSLTDDLPIPNEWKGTGDVAGISREELRRAYIDAVHNASEPTRERSRGAFEICVKRAKDFDVRLPEVAVCQKWLDDHPRPSP